MKRPGKLFYTLAPLFLVLVIDSMGFGLVFPILGPLFTGEGGIVSAHMALSLRNVLYGVTLTSFSIFMFLGAPLLGDLSDYMGRKKVITLCLLATSAGLALSGLAIEMKSLALLLFARALSGFFAGSQSIAQAAIIDVSAEKEKAANLGLVTLAMCVGFAMGPMLGGWLTDTSVASWFTYGTPFFAAAIFAGLNAIALQFTFKETVPTKTGFKLQWGKAIHVFVSAFRHPKVRLIAIIFLLLMVGWGLYFQFISLYLAEFFHYSPLGIGHYMAWVGVLFGLSLSVIVRLVMQTFKVEAVIIVFTVMAGLGAITVASPLEWTQWWSVVPITIGTALAEMGLLTLFSGAVDADSQGWVMGVSSAVGAASWSVAAGVAAVVGHFGFVCLFVTAGLFMLLSALLGGYYLRFVRQ